MNRAEMVMLTRYVHAMCPSQKTDEYTADAWADVLGDLRLVDAKLAVAAVAARQPWVSPSDIRATVRAVRDDRIEKAPPYEPGSGLTLLEWRRRAADGDVLPAIAGLRARPVQRAIAGTFPSPPSAA